MLCRKESLFIHNGVTIGNKVYWGKGGEPKNMPQQNLWGGGCMKRVMSSISLVIITRLIEITSDSCIAFVKEKQA